MSEEEEQTEKSERNTERRVNALSVREEIAVAPHQARHFWTRTRDHEKVFTKVMRERRQGSRISSVRISDNERLETRDQDVYGENTQPAARYDPSLRNRMEMERDRWRIQFRLR